MISLRNCAVLLVLLVAACGARAEPELMSALASPDADVVYEALADLERGFPGSTPAQRRMIELVHDPRPVVRRKAARVLGAIHAPVDPPTVTAIGAMLAASDVNEVIDALKALRGMPARSEIPRMLPLLKHQHENVVRDACRTLAVVGDASVVPQIEPLLASGNDAIRADAKAAIAALANRR
jgi:HEAT repeat protein